MRFYWHIHHNVLVEPTWNIEERRDYIKRRKSNEEISLRLKLIKPAKGIPDSIKSKLREYGDFDLTAEEVAKVVALHSEQCNPRCPWVSTPNPIYPFDRLYGTMLTYHDGKEFSLIPNVQS